MNGSQAAVSYIDDDSIASYYFSLGTDLDYVTENGERLESPNQVIAGPRGTYLKMRIQSSLELNTSSYLFDQLGGVQVWSVTDPDGGFFNFQFIDSTLRVSGATTGYSVDVPIRFTKYLDHS